MEAVRGEIGSWKANRFHVAVFHLRANRDVIRCHHHLYARRSIATTPRLQSSVDSETDHCSQDQGHKANHQKPGAIHELPLKIEIATTAGDSMTRNGDARTRRNSDFQLRRLGIGSRAHTLLRNKICRAFAGRSIRAKGFRQL